jgi:hypothetical protein
MSKNSTKILRVDLDILYSHKVVSRENNIFCIVYKKTKFGAKIGIARDFFCLFTQDMKMSVFHETKRVHIEWRDLRVKFLFDFFDVFKMFFQRWEHMLPCPESNSPCYYIMAHMSWHANNELIVAAFVWQFFYYLHICLLRHLMTSNHGGVHVSNVICLLYMSPTI